MQESSTMLHIRMDKDLKADFENACDDMGLSATSAVKLFAKAVIREGKIPFEITTGNKDK